LYRVPVGPTCYGLLLLIGGATIEQSLAIEEVPFVMDDKMCVGTDSDLGVKLEVKIFRMTLKEETGDV
jgi:hypothetical protein